MREREREEESGCQYLQRMIPDKDPNDDPGVPVMELKNELHKCSR